MNRYDHLEEVVDNFVANLNSAVHQEVAAFKSSNVVSSDLNRGAQEVFTPHLFDELPASKKYQLNEEGRKLIFALRYYFRRLRVELRTKPTRPITGFRQTRRPKNKRRRRNVPRDGNILTVDQWNNSLNHDTPEYPADCCGLHPSRRFATAENRAASNRERALATSNPSADALNNITYDTRDLLSDGTKEENDGNLNMSFGSINVKEEEETASLHHSPSPNTPAATESNKTTSVTESKARRDERRKNILLRQEQELLAAASSSDEGEDEYEDLDIDHESTISPAMRKKLQSKLLKGLLKDAKLQRLRTFKMNEDPTIRKIEFHQWLLSIQAITASYLMLMDLLNEYPHTISPKIQSQIGNVALFYFLRNYVDSSIQNMFQSHPEDGVSCLHLLRRHCAQLTASDTSIQYTRFATTVHRRDEHVLSYIQRFNAAKVMAESVGNTFSESHLLQLFIGNFVYPGIYTSTVNTIRARILQDQYTQENQRLTLADATTLLLQVESERSNNNNNMQNNDRSGRNRHQARATRYRERGGRKNNRTRKDISEITCYKCHQKGHYATSCPQSDQDNDNNNNKKTLPPATPKKFVAAAVRVTETQRACPATSRPRYDWVNKARESTPKKSVQLDC